MVRLRIKHEETTDGLLRSKEEEQPKEGCHDFLRRGSLTKRDRRIPQSHHGNFRIRGHTRSQPQSQPITRLKRESTPVNSLAVERQTTSIFHDDIKYLGQWQAAVYEVELEHA